MQFADLKSEMNARMFDYDRAARQAMLESDAAPDAPVKDASVGRFRIPQWVRQPYRLRAYHS